MLASDGSHREALTITFHELNDGILIHCFLGVSLISTGRRATRCTYQGRR